MKPLKDTSSYQYGTNKDNQCWYPIRKRRIREWIDNDLLVSCNYQLLFWIVNQKNKIEKKK